MTSRAAGISSPRPPLGRALLVLALATVCACCSRSRTDAVADAHVSEGTVTDAAAGSAAPPVIALNDGGIELDGRSIGQATPQRGNPFLLPSLDAELRRLPAPTSSRVVIHVPRESAYQELVPLMFTAGQAEYSNIDLLFTGEASAPSQALTIADPPLFALPSSDGCTRTIVEPALAVRLVRDAATHWMIGLVAFGARVDRTGKCAPAVAASGFVSALPRAELPVDCTRAFAADLAARQACTAGHDAGKGDARAVLGGPNGCLGRALPQGESLATWTAALRGAFATFRLSGASTQLSADPLETNGAVLEVARAIRERTTLSLGMPKPSDAASGPSSCREAVHTYEELRLAAARWLGAPAP